MKIAGRPIGPGHPTYIIAELGVNHDGSAQRALELIDVARRCGADAVKFQYFEPARLLSRSAVLAAYQEAGGADDPFAMLSALTLDLVELRTLCAHAHFVGLHAIVTVFSVELVTPAVEMAWDAFKVASPDLVNLPLINALRDTCRPIIISTGAATLNEVERTVEHLRAVEALAVMQCVSAYPTPEEHASLGGIHALRESCGRPVGYSDHTSGIDTGGFAVAAGACMIEKHLTHDRHASGPDHAASLDPDGFAEYVSVIRRAERMMGRYAKTVLDVEQDVRLVSRQSVTLRQDRPAGHVLEAGDLTVQRPGRGIPAWEMDALIGRTLVRPVEAGTLLAPEDLD